MLILMAAMLISNHLKDGDEEGVPAALKRGDRDGWQMRMFKKVIIIVIIVIVMITTITINMFVIVLTIILIILTITIIVIIIIIVAILFIQGGRPLADANVQAEVCSP